MIKLLHAADFHLDSAFASVSAEQAVQRRKEQRLALQTFAKLCEGCDIVLLCGDLFDSAHIYRDTLDALKDCLAAIPAQIFIAPGNHDYIRSGCAYLTEDWSENVHIFTKASIERVHLPSLGCDIYGAAFTSSEQPSLLENFRIIDPTAVNIMLLHGDVQPNSPYNAISQTQIAASGLDYLALGHIHTAQRGKIGQTTFAFPGCLMGRGFDECGQKGVLRVCVDKQQCTAEFLPIESRKYEILTVEVSDDVLGSIRAALPNGHNNDCYRIILKGESSSIDTTALEAALKDEFFTLSIKDRTLPKQDLWSAIAEDTLRGHFLRELKAQYDEASEEDKLAFAAAAKLGLALMDGREVSL